MPKQPQSIENELPGSQKIPYCIDLIKQKRASLYSELRLARAPRESDIKGKSLTHPNFWRRLLLPANVFLTKFYSNSGESYVDLWPH